MMIATLAALAALSSTSPAPAASPASGDEVRISTANLPAPDARGAEMVRRIDAAATDYCSTSPRVADGVVPRLACEWHVRHHIDRQLPAPYRAEVRDARRAIRR
jgi:UrcA family protein